MNALCSTVAVVVWVTVVFVLVGLLQPDKPTDDTNNKKIKRAFFIIRSFYKANMKAAATQAGNILSTFAAH